MPFPSVKIKSLRRIAAWLLVLPILSFLLPPLAVFAEGPPDTYIKDFSSQMDKEQTALGNLVRTYNSLDLGNPSRLSAFQNELRAHQKVFDDSVRIYKTPLPSGVPTSLVEATRLAIAASESLSSGARLMDRGISARDQRSLAQAETLLNEGKGKLSLAVDAYNSFVDEYNRKQSPPSLIGNEFGLAPSLDMTLTVGTPLVYAYGYLLVAGLLLSLYFQLKLRSLISGSTKPGKFKGTGLYGMHLAFLFPYLYALLGFSLLLLLDFALVSVSLLAGARRIPIGLVFALVIVVFGSLVAIVRGFLGSANMKPFGRLCTRKEQPDVWKLCDAVAVDVDTKTVDEVFLSPQPGIGVYLEGGLFSMLVGRTKRVLTIGMGSIIGLSVSEMRAILAHEFGHFSNKDTAWNSLTFTMASALHNALSTMPSPWRSVGSGWVRLTSALNPALWALMAYRLLFALVTTGFSRMREVLADKTAISLYGCSSFTSGLMKVGRNDYVLSGYLVPEMARMLTEDNRVFVNVFQTMEERYRSLDGGEISRLEGSLLSQEKRSPFDTHPLLRERMAYAKRFEVEAKYPAGDDSVKTLFDDWDGTTKSLSDLYSYYVAVLTGHSLEPSDSATTESAIDRGNDVLRGSGSPPPGAIKAKRQSMVYHIPGGQFYDRIVADEWFATEAYAQAAGYRRSRR